MLQVTHDFETFLLPAILNLGTPASLNAPRREIHPSGDELAFPGKVLGSAGVTFPGKVLGSAGVAFPEKVLGHAGVTCPGQVLWTG